MLFWSPEKLAKDSLKFQKNIMSLCFPNLHLEIEYSNVSFSFALCQDYNLWISNEQYMQNNNDLLHVFQFLLFPRGHRQQKHLHSWSRFFSVNETAGCKYRGSWREGWWRYSIRGIPRDEPLTFHSQREKTYLAGIPNFRHIYHRRGQGIDFSKASTWTEELAMRLLRQVISKNIPGLCRESQVGPVPSPAHAGLKGFFNKTSKAQSETKERYSGLTKIKEIYKGVSEWKKGRWNAQGLKPRCQYLAPAGSSYRQLEDCRKWAKGTDKQCTEEIQTRMRIWKDIQNYYNQEKANKDTREIPHCIF